MAGAARAYVPSRRNALALARLGCRELASEDHAHDGGAIGRFLSVPAHTIDFVDSKGAVMDARARGFLDQEDARIADLIRRHGWAIQAIDTGTCTAPGCGCPETDGPAFAYTVGLFGLGHPELLIFGLPASTAAHVLNQLGTRIRAGNTVVPGVEVAVADFPSQIIPEEVPNSGDIVFSANRFYQRPPEASVPVLQLTYKDSAGRFPWEPGFNGSGHQPRPGSFLA